MIIWLASYPRSGNTFLRIVLNKCFNIKTYSVYGDKFDIASHKKTSDVVGHKQLPENFEIETARKSKKLYLIKTHGYIQTEDKVIVKIRLQTIFVYMINVFSGNTGAWISSQSRSGDFSKFPAYDASFYLQLIFR